MAQLQEALRRDPNYLPARHDLGTLYAERGDMEQAIAAFTAVLQRDPRWVQAHYNLALAYRARGEMAAMLRELQETVSLDPRHVEAHVHLAVLYFQEQRYELAWQHGQKAAELGAPVQPLLEALRKARGTADERR
jgi:tetratricopeptide (TPR) repeat protein